MSIMVDGVAWNSRYYQYARVQDRKPDEQLMHDDEACPGGKMCGYILWNGRRLQEFRRLLGLKGDAPMWEADYKAYDAWLDRQVTVSLLLAEF